MPNINGTLMTQIGQIITDKNCINWQGQRHQRSINFNSGVVYFDTAL